MKKRKVLAFIALVMVLAGFCLPWLEFYGLISGVSAVRIASETLLTGSGWTSSWFTLLALIPFLAGVNSWAVFIETRSQIPVLSAVVMDLLAGFAFWGITGYVNWKSIWYGYPLMVVGIVLLNGLAMHQYMRRK
jgi:hypothetical protein